MKTKKEEPKKVFGEIENELMKDSGQMLSEGISEIAKAFSPNRTKLIQRLGRIEKEVTSMMGRASVNIQNKTFTQDEILGFMRLASLAELAEECREEESVSGRQKDTVLGSITQMIPLLIKLKS